MSGTTLITNKHQGRISFNPEQNLCSNDQNTKILGNKKTTGDAYESKK